MPVQAVDWNERQVQTLRDLWAAGDSCARIARAVGQGCTRSAVAGKARRLSLPPRASGPRAAAKQQPKMPKCTALAHHSVALPPEPVVASEPLLLAGNPITVETILDSMCRWPIGDPATAQFQFCGNSPKAGHPYCEAHCRAAYTPAFAPTRPDDGRRRNGIGQRRGQVSLWE